VEWAYTMEKEGEVVYHKEGILPDPFSSLQQAVQTATSKARVSVTIQRSIQYGEVKCSFTLSVDCPQEKSAMDYAAEHVFIQAVQYVNDGMERLAPGLQPFPVLTPKIP